jgi:hypothetical protein
MAQVHINNIVVDNNPAPVLAPLKFHVTFDCFTPLPGTFDWKIIYIGSPENSQFDQVVDSFDMDNLQAGIMQFTVDSAAPNFALVPPEEIVGTPPAMQAPPRSSFRSPTRSRSSSAAGTTCGTDTRRDSPSRSPVPPPSTSQTSGASSSQRVPASSALRSSGRSVRAWCSRTPVCSAATSQHLGATPSSSRMAPCRNWRNELTATACSRISPTDRHTHSPLPIHHPLPPNRSSVMLQMPIFPKTIRSRLA